MKSTRTMLHRNSKFIIIDIQTGATSIFVYGVSFIQQLCNEPGERESEIERSNGMDKDGKERVKKEGRERAFAFRYMPAKHRSNCGSSFNPLSKAIG